MKKMAKINMDNNSFALLSLVAIVAIIGVVSLVMTQGNGFIKTGNDNIAGEGYKFVTSKSAVSEEVIENKGCCNIDGNIFFNYDYKECLGYGGSWIYDCDTEYHCCWIDSTQTSTWILDSSCNAQGGTIMYNILGDDECEMYSQDEECCLFDNIFQMMSANDCTNLNGVIMQNMNIDTCTGSPVFEENECCLVDNQYYVWGPAADCVGNIVPEDKCEGCCELNNNYYWTSSASDCDDDGGNIIPWLLKDECGN